MAMGNMVKVLGWYDNEWGYSNRLVDLAKIVGAATSLSRSRPSRTSRRRSGASTASASWSGRTSTSPWRTARITDDLRIRAALPDAALADRPGRRGHRHEPPGSPQGARTPAFSLEPVMKRLAEVAPGVALLENLRFDPGETANDPATVARLVEGQDGYVNDAFGASHRAHASIVGPPATLPSAAGRLLANEVDVLLGVRSEPEAARSWPSSAARRSATSWG